MIMVQYMLSNDVVMYGEAEEAVVMNFADQNMGYLTTVQHFEIITATIVFTLLFYLIRPMIIGVSFNPIRMIIDGCLLYIWLLLTVSIANRKTTADSTPYKPVI